MGRCRIKTETKHSEKQYNVLRQTERNETQKTMHLHGVETLTTSTTRKKERSSEQQEPGGTFAAAAAAVECARL